MAESNRNLSFNSGLLRSAHFRLVTVTAPAAGPGTVSNTTDICRRGEYCTAHYSTVHHTKASLQPLLQPPITTPLTAEKSK